MNVENIAFIDIETVSVSKKIHEISKIEELYTKRFSYKFDASEENDKRDELFYHWMENAMMYAEFGKIICVCIGKIGKKEVDGRMEPIFYIRKITGGEPEILEQLTRSLELAGPLKLCAHNGKDFDFPFLFRRYVINKLNLPAILNPINKKPWETAMLDTLEMWSGTQWRHKVSLDLLCELLAITSPKSDLDGSKISEVYYSGEPDAIDKIADYCALDVLACYKVYCRMMGIPTVEKTEYL